MGKDVLGFLGLSAGHPNNARQHLAPDYTSGLSRHNTVVQGTNGWGLLSLLFYVCSFFQA